jgi:hypothetical protein
MESGAASMSLPALLLSINGLSISAHEEGSSDDLVELNNSEDEEKKSKSDSPERPGPSEDRTLERPRNRPRTRDAVFSDWSANQRDSSSSYIRRLGDTKNDPYKTHDEDFIEVEVPCSLFARLSTAVSTFRNPMGEPDDWQFDNSEKHAYLKSDNPKMDQPWLQARLDHDTNEWVVFNHEGRHRSAWVCNHMGYENITVLIGLYWDADKDEDIDGADVMDFFTGSGAKAQLLLNTRAGSVQFKLKDVTPANE